MQLVAFSVTNYRSITKAYKLPLRKSTALIGPNNEGKSNILRALVTSLDALSNFSRIRVFRGRVRTPYYMREPYDWAKDFPISLQNSHPEGESIFNLDFELTDAEIDEFWNEVKSSLDGTLPVQLSLGRKDPGFKILKKGPGAAALSKKAEAIAQFVARRININYIPAVRTADSSYRIVSDIVESELSVIEQDAKYQQALAAVEKLQEPVLQRISQSIQETLREFLPKVTGVSVSIPREERSRALRRSCEIIVNDGTPTQLARKGDGVQSLAALSLMRHASVTSASGRNLILAIEEPESHLHPLAIHQLKSVLAEIGRKHQVIMTTHSPLFVDRSSLKSNILVHGNKAVPAKSITDIRDILGVRAADNLQHAELILVVEGEEDRRALIALLKHFDSQLRCALDEGTLAIDTLQGASNLAYKLSLIRDSVCSTYTFLDHDQSGIEAFRKAERDGLASQADTTFTICPGMKDSELEDLFDDSLYGDMLQNKWRVSIASPKFKGAKKWSDRLRDTFLHQGKIWDNGVEAAVKAAVAELVEASPEKTLNNHKRSSFDALVIALKQKLNDLSAEKK